MKFKGTKLSKRTMALLAAAVILLGGSGITGTKAALTVFSPDYDARIETNSISVALTENDTTVKDGGKLFASLEGKAEPGMKYNDTVGVTNDGAAPEYVRVIVRKYWTKPEKTEEGEPVPSDEKDQTLSPDMIDLELADAGKWIEKDGGSVETKIYYLKSQLGTGKSAALFSSVKIDKAVAKARRIYHDGTEISEAEVSGVTSGTITYEYKYNGYTFNVEAEAQSVQTHSPVEAIKSIWGVTASMSGDTITAIQ